MISSQSSWHLVIILLRTNDLKVCFAVSAYDIANGAGALVQIVQKSETGRGGDAPQVLLLAPPPVAVGRRGSAPIGFAEMFEGTEAKSERLAEHYARVSQERGCAFLDTGQVIVSSDLDGIHLEAGEHSKLGVAVAARVRELLAYRIWELSGFGVE